MSANERAMREMVAQIDARTAQLFEGVGAEAEHSIVDGSELTTASGQPVDTGFLKGSWSRVYDSPTRQTISTNAAYAEAVEDGVGPHGPRAYGAERSDTSTGSTVGGSHSVAKTVIALPRVLDVVTERTRR
jgi:hypothetical protein